MGLAQLVAAPPRWGLRGGGWREPAPGKEEWQPVGHCILTAGLLTIRERATKFKPEFRAKINNNKKYDIKIKMI